MRKAEPIAGLGGLLLLMSLFLDWYETDPDKGDLQLINTLRVSGWDSFAIIDILLALFALLALAVPIVSLTTQGPAKSIRTASLASAFCWLAIVLIAFRLLDPPASAFTPIIGAWLGLAGSILAWLGSWLSLQGRVPAGPGRPDLPRRPAPPPESA